MGCAPSSEEAGVANESALNDSASDATTAGIQEGSIEADGVLLLLNDRQTTTFEVLDSRSGIEVDVAKAIADYRTDAEGKPRWFKTLAEVDALPGTTPEVFTKLLADARANLYVDEGAFDPPTLAQIVAPEFGPVTSETVRVDAGFDGMSPDDARRLVRNRVPNNIHRENEAFLNDTIARTHKAFTLGIGNLFVANAPFAGWLRGLGADKITMLGTMSTIHPTVLLTEKGGVKSYWIRNSSGYEPIDWPTYHYPIIMKGYVRLETDPEGQGIRIFYPACPLKVLESSTHVVVEDNPDP